MQKSVVLSSGWYDRAVVKRGEEGGHKTILYVNELGVVGSGPTEKWDEKPMTGGLEFLKYMGASLDIHQGVVFTRDKQTKPFWRRYRDDDQNPLGYDWVRTDGEKLSTEDRKEVERLDMVLQNCGTEFEPMERRWNKRRRNLSGFMSALVADTLTADACPIETERAVNGSILGWYNIPFDTVRLARESGYLGDDRIVAVQVLMNQAIVGLTKDEIVYEVRNPRSQLEYGDYGMSELEHFIRLGTSYLNTCTFNAASLDRNSMPRGFLTLHGRYDQPSLNFFTQQFNALLRGAGKRWAMPVLVAPNGQEGGAKWTPVDTSTAEMMMTKWLVFVVSLYAALHGMSPEELNMESFSAKGASIGGKSDTAERLQSGHDKGLVQLIKWAFDDVLNPYIVRPLSKKYRITPVGLFPDNEEQRHERQKLTMTVDEVRAIDGVDPQADPEIGNAPLNPVHAGIYGQKIMMKRQQEMQAAGGTGAEMENHLPGSESPLPYQSKDEEADAGNGKGNGNGKPGGLMPPNGGVKMPGMKMPGMPGMGGGAGAMAKAAVPRLRVEIRDLRTNEIETIGI